LKQHQRLLEGFYEDNHGGNPEILWLKSRAEAAEQDRGRPLKASAPKAFPAHSPRATTHTKRFSLRSLRCDSPPPPAAASAAAASAQIWTATSPPVAPAGVALGAQQLD